MWDLYAQAGNGIALRSTAERLVQSLNADVANADAVAPVAFEPAAFYLGLVRYVDYENDVVVPSTALDYLTCKRKSFEHERELRAAVLSVEPVVGGQNVACDLDVLIESIYVSPAAPVWFRSAVQGVVARYGIGMSVLQSDLDQDPLL